MPRVETTVDIQAPVGEVWDALMDPHRLEEWVTIHRRLERVSESPLREGSTLEQTLCLAHTNFKVRWTVTRLDEPRLAVWEGKGPVRSKATTVYRLEANGRGTRFSYENEFKAPGGPLGAAAGRMLVGGISHREAERSLARLKSLLER